MHWILDILNQPIVLTLITLTVGSYLLSLIADRRSRKEVLKDKAIEFLTQAGDHINALFPLIYGPLRQGRVEMNPEIDDGLRALFATNISVRVGSQAYLGSSEFHRQYMMLCNELGAVVGILTALEQSGASEEVLQRIGDHRKRLADSWPRANEPPDSSANQPVEALILWMDMIVERTADLLSSHLKSVLR